MEPLKKQYPGKKLAVILNQQDLLKEPEKVRAAIEAQMSVPVFLHSREEKKKQIHMILLAAGFSRRFGENKLLYPIKGKPMYLWTMEKLKEIQKEGLADSLVVVSQYEEILKEAARQEIPGVKIPAAKGGFPPLSRSAWKRWKALRDGIQRTIICFLWRISLFSERDSGKLPGGF